MSAKTTKQQRLDAEHRFPVRLRLLVPKEGYGNRLDRMHAWLNERVGIDGTAQCGTGYSLYPDETSCWYFPTFELAAEFMAAFKDVAKVR